MGFFQSNKKVLLNKVKKREWRSTEQMREVFDELAAEDVRLADLTWMLVEPDRMVRQYAVQILTAKQISGAALALLKEARGTTGSSRSYLVNTIPKLGEDSSVIDRIAGMLESKDERERELGLDIVLAYPPEKVLPQLAILLQHEDREYRHRGLQKLTSGRPEGEPLEPRVLQMVRPLLEDADERIRIRCVQVLCEHPETSTIKAIIERLVREQYNVQTAIIKQLEGLMARPELGMVDLLLPLLSHGDDLIRSTALQLTVRHGDPVEIIRKILVMSDDLLGWMRDRILRTIREFGEELIKPIAELMAHPEKEIRARALMYASDFDSPLLVRPAIEILRETDWWTRVIAMDLLGRLRDERAVEPLIDLLGDDEVRWSAVEALSRIGSKRALGPIAKLLGDKAPEVRLQVITALEAYGDPRAQPLLKKSMEKDPDIQVRERALEAYRRIAEANDQAVDEGALRASFGYGKSERRIDKLLTEGRKVGASDLHVSPGSQPIIRLAGELHKSGKTELTPEQTEQLIKGMLTPRQLERFEKEHQLDFCYVIPGVGRYRSNVYKQRNGYGGVFRVIPNELPSFLDTGLPEHIVDVVNYHQGLIIVSGPAGSGKSTTLAALVNLINEKRRHHILTLEDPIEFVHPYKQSLVNQREINSHTRSFAAALRAALREDPDVIVVGELRDQETMTLAMTAAETGHVVIGTMNTTSAVKTVSRLIDAFPPKEQPSVRMMLSESLKIVTSQTLVRRADKKGRVACHEVLMVTGPVGNLIRDNKLNHIPSAMTIGREHGMQTVDMALQQLVERHLVAPEDAYMRAHQKELFEAMVSQAFLEGQEA